LPSPPPLPPPPHPASTRVNNNAKASGTLVSCHWIVAGCFRHLRAPSIAARTKASMSRPLRPGAMGRTGGAGREQGALTEGAVVVTVTATLVVELPGVTGLGETAQVASEGAPVQLSVTAWFIPATPPRLRV